MMPDPIIGRRLFVDGIVRPVFADDTGAQYVIDAEGHTCVYGVGLADADEALIVKVQER
jgi:hypothetical protein